MLTVAFECEIWSLLRCGSKMKNCSFLFIDTNSPFLDHSDNIFNILCRSRSFPAINAMSSAYTKIEIKISSKATPQRWFFISWAKSFTYIENEVGDKTHHCFTPILTWSHSVKLSFILIVQETDLYSDWIAVRKSACTPIFKSLNYRHSLSTVSNAFFASRKQTEVFVFPHIDMHCTS